MNETTKISEGAIFFNNSTTRTKSQRKMMLMRKPRSPHEVVFNPDPEDNFFVNVDIKKAKTGEVKASHYILRSDVPQWQRQYERDGFEIVSTNI